MECMSDNAILQDIFQRNSEISRKEKMYVVMRMSVPGMLAQISEIAMQYIDAAMVGSLGAAASASIGLVSSSTWLMGGMISGTAAGFYVQIAHAVGAGRYENARNVLRQSLIVAVSVGILLALIGSFLAPWLPEFLGAEEYLYSDASAYFLAYSLFIPARMLFYLLQGALQSTGNMKTPSILSALMCMADVVFNFFLIFPTREVNLLGMHFTVWGADLGVLGAGLGTAFAYAVILIPLFYFIFWKSESLSLRKSGSWKFQKEILSKAVHIGLPMAAEQVAMTSAQVFSTRIVAPLGTAAIAANSFAVTAESICYMPGYGIASASTTLVGQSVGAHRKDLARSFAWISTLLAMGVMTVTGVLMYFLCPYVFAFLTPDTEVQQLGISALRIELLAEPMFAASIAATGALRGASDTLVPGIMNLVSIWGVRIVLASVLAPIAGLNGVWTAMAIEITFRGIIFLVRLKREKWLKKFADA